MEWLLIIFVPLVLLWLYNYFNDPMRKIKQGNREYDKLIRKNRKKDGNILDEWDEIMEEGSFTQVRKNDDN